MGTMAVEIINQKKKLLDDLWVILPGHNEENNIKDVLLSVKKYAKNIVFVDDGSTDSTYKISTSMDIIVLSHITNLGKGSALRTGCDFALKNGAKYIVVMDSDGQHRPEEIKLFIDKFLEGYDVVFGCRKFNKDMPFVMKTGNYGLHKFSSLFFKVDVKDTQSGYRAFTSSAYEQIRWLSSDYSMESEMIARLHKKNLKYCSVNISTIYLDDYKGTTVINGVIILTNMFLWKLFGLADNKIEEL